MKRLYSISATALLPLILAVGCGDDSNEDTSAGDAGDQGDAGDAGTATTGGDAGTDTGTPAGCADPNDPNAVKMGLNTEISADTTLTCDTVWVLENPVFVRGATLAIEAGTTIQGTGGSALVIDQGASIDARGTADAPIVMTSALPAGQRNRGDWGGLVLLGAAPINLDGGVGAAEGFATPPSYGGNDAAYNCGTLQYVRVEWAGFELSAGNELNGITFYACGSGTTVDHVQVHMGQDDGIEMFGGNFDAKFLVVSGAADDSLDCDQGYRGRLQHVFIHQDPAVGDNAFEWSNQGANFTAMPRTGPIIANATIVGSGAGGDKSKGVTLKEGTEAFIHSSIFHNVTNELMLLTHQETQDNATGGSIAFSGNLLSGHGGFGVDDGTTWTAPDLEAWVLDMANGNVDGGDPGLPSIEWTNPNVAPAPGSTPDGMGATPTDAWFDQTTYAGAVDPNGTDWTQEAWVSFAID